jgi:hypothetical protein
MNVRLSGWPERRLAAARHTARFAVAALIYSGFAMLDRDVVRQDLRPSLTWVAAVTVVVAVVLWVARDRLERLVAKAVLGDRAVGHEVMHGLVRRMTTTLPVDEVAPRMAEAASRSTGRSRAEVAVWLAAGERWTQTWPPTSPPVSNETRYAFGVRHGGAEVGQIAVGLGDDDLSPLDRRLLDALAGPAGLALGTVQLTVQLRRRKAELEQVNVALRSSRDRLLAVRAGEQRRMRTELAATVLPHVAAAMAGLGGADAEGAPEIDGGLTSTVAVRADPELKDIEQAGVEAGLALDRIRLIARGIFPPRLSDDGLASSVDGWLLREEASATIEVDGDVAALHAQAEQEACLYFCIVTVLRALLAVDASDLRISVTVGPQIELAVSGRTDEPLDGDSRLVVADRIEAFGGMLTDVAEAGRSGIRASVPGAPGSASTPPTDTNRGPHQAGPP